MLHKVHLTFVLVATVSLATAQEWKDLGPDALFFAARNEVFEGNRRQGQEKLMYLLQKYPAITMQAFYFQGRWPGTVTMTKPGRC